MGPRAWLAVATAALATAALLREGAGRPEPYCPPYEPMANLVPEAECGGFAVEHFELDARDVMNALIRDAANGRSENIDLVPGRHARLSNRRDGFLGMSDTPMERRTNLPFVARALQVGGDVLVAGLGLGMVLVPLLRSEAVASVTVLEREPEVVSLVEPALRSLPRAEPGAEPGIGGLRVVVADAHEWRPPSGAAYSAIYADLWPDICADNLEEMDAFRIRYEPYLAPGCPRQALSCWREGETAAL